MSVPWPSKVIRTTKGVGVGRKTNLALEPLGKLPRLAEGGQEGLACAKLPPRRRAGIAPPTPEFWPASDKTSRHTFTPTRTGRQLGLPYSAAPWSPMARPPRPLARRRAAGSLLAAAPSRPRRPPSHTACFAQTARRKTCLGGLGASSALPLP